MIDAAILFDLSGRTAVVTGGAGLLGAEFCKTLLGAGANVVIADINENTASALSNELSSQREPGGSSPMVSSIQVDITSEKSVKALFQSVSGEFDKVDILVNAAAIDPKFDPGSQRASDSEFSFDDYPLELWKQALDVNLTGTFLCCQSAGKMMETQGGGVMINISSIYGIVGPDQRIYKTSENPYRYKPAYYSTTKAGILGLTRYLATYYAQKNIRVNALTPGGVFNEHEPGFVDAYSSRTVLGRMGRKNEMNGALLFLASDASAYMTGSNLIVDGGWTAW
jgi:NAD(P)-dependent dehydrogenase (short-subunit alcohol dehydrogenase family)